MSFVLIQPFDVQVEADFDGVEVKSTAAYVVQLCNDTAEEQVRETLIVLICLFIDCSVCFAGFVSSAVSNGVDS